MCIFAPIVSNQSRVKSASTSIYQVFYQLFYYSHWERATRMAISFYWKSQMDSFPYFNINAMLVTRTEMNSRVLCWYPVIETRSNARKYLLEKYFSPREDRQEVERTRCLTPCTWHNFFLQKWQILVCRSPPVSHQHCNWDEEDLENIWHLSHWPELERSDVSISLVTWVSTSSLTKWDIMRPLSRLCAPDHTIND